MNTIRISTGPSFLQNLAFRIPNALQILLKLTGNLLLLIDCIPIALITWVALFSNDSKFIEFGIASCSLSTPTFAIVYRYIFALKNKFFSYDALYRLICAPVSNSMFACSLTLSVPIILSVMVGKSACPFVVADKISEVLAP